jgi:hypothetical protein
VLLSEELATLKDSMKRLRIHAAEEFPKSRADLVTATRLLKTREQGGGGTATDRDPGSDSLERADRGAECDLERAGVFGGFEGGSGTLLGSGGERGGFEPGGDFSGAASWVGGTSRPGGDLCAVAVSLSSGRDLGIDAPDCQLGDRGSSLPAWYGAVAWGLALGLHWKEYLARPEAVLCPAMRRGQLGVGLGLSGIFLLGNSSPGVLVGGEWLPAVLSLQLTGFCLGLGVTHFVRMWTSFAGFLPMIYLSFSRDPGRMFFADWMLGENVWSSLFAVGASVCGIMLIVDRYFTMREESIDYWQPMLTLKGMQEYGLRKGEATRRWARGSDGSFGSGWRKSGVSLVDGIVHRGGG